MNIVEKTEAYLNKYVTFAEPWYSLPSALWSLATHSWQAFDAFPYFAISAPTKKSGKTTFKDCMVPLSPNGRKFSVSSVASMSRILEENKQTDFPVMFVDECERLIDENHPAREFLNKGFERGEYLTKFLGGESVNFDCYCPKVFVGIGGIYDTLKDRSIRVMMKRRSPIESAKAVRIRQSIRDAEGMELREQMKILVQEKADEIKTIYEQAEMLSFLDERAEKCWTPLFIMAKLFCPERLDELTRIAVDMEADKDAPELRATGKVWEKAEQDADDADARTLLLLDMLKICQDKKYILTEDALELLKDIPTSQWRRFRGTGLTADHVGYLFDAFNLHPKVIRINPDRNASRATRRGYKLEDLKAAGVLAGLIEETD